MHSNTFLQSVAVCQTVVLVDHLVHLFSQNNAVASQTNIMIMEGQRGLSAGKNLSASVQWLVHETMPKDKMN